MADFQWNVYTARVGFVESDVTKLRPVFVLNDPVGVHKIVLVAPIFSAKPAHILSGDIKITDGHSDLGLLKPSTIRLHRIVSLPASDLQEQLGQVPIKLRATIKAELKKLFNFE
ncbi:type II toxin-antitoxin system PemK/MazF family toxin [Candidatus Saccharibacteria bacterium]|nr:type II toxin-antitoxin system PemK/MazF family toxin [Candidatus Saccharibacteria bacterium]